MRAILILVSVLWVIGWLSPSAQSQELDFNHDVVPILSKHCVACHGGREAKGSFSINTRELVAESGHVDLEDAGKSNLIELVRSKDEDLQMPPKDRPRLAAAEIEVLEKWIGSGLKWEAGFSFAPEAYEPPLLPRRPELPPAVEGRDHPIDRILDNFLKSAGKPLPAPVSDAVFLRRAHLDLVGLLPSPAELQSFQEDRSPDKRKLRIQELLGNRVAYADHWMTFFNDLLRNDYSGTGFITGGRKQISGWLYASLLENKPFDAMARELIAPSSTGSQGFADGIKWRGEVSAGQTVEIQFAQSVAQSFLGINLKCASCHDSFIDRWKLDEAYGLAAIYSDHELEISRCDKPVGRKAVASWLFPEIGQIDPAADRNTRLRQLADLMTHPENGRFPRTIVNRLWHRLMGHGIVHPMDAMQTRPWNDDLLDYLAVYLVDAQYDLKKVLEWIATSEAYQSQAEVVTDAQSIDYVYAGPRARRLTAEQFVDAIWQVCGAAPARYDAPVFRTMVGDSPDEAPQPSAKWIWRSEGENPPPAGETILIYKKLHLEKAPVLGGAVLTCDNEFTLFINGREVDRGNDWTELHSVALQGALVEGNNTIAAVAKNAGSGPNAAGFYFSAQLKFEDGSTQTVDSDESWQWSLKTPAGREGRLGAVPMDLKPVQVVPTVGAWSEKIDPVAAQILAAVASGQMPMVRASLMKNDALLRSLGRPTRDQIVSMRPAELTTLEAIDLANQPQFAQWLQRGSERLVSEFSGDPNGLIQHVYLQMLARRPSNDESKVLREMVGDASSPGQVQDLVWSVCMLPEFWTVR